MDTTDLKTTVLRTAGLRNVWKSPHPRVLEHNSFELPSKLVPDDVLFHSEKFMLVQKKEDLLAYDLELNTYIGGHHGETEFIWITSFWAPPAGNYVISLVQGTMWYVSLF